VGASKANRKTLRRLTMNFYLDGEFLCRRSFDGTLLRCLNEADTRNTLQEVHERTCSTHTSAHDDKKNIKGLLFFNGVKKDCIDYVNNIISIRCIVIRSMHPSLLYLI
jgi:hypothetical protein